MRTGPAGERRLFVLIPILVLAAAFYGVFIERTAFDVDGETHWSLFDDAMISMRYARNLADGEGLRWNPGEPAVEGYTNFLWTLALAGIHVLPLPESKTSLAVMVLGAGLLLAGAGVAWKLAARLSGPGIVVPAAACALTAFSYPVMFWTLRGLEVGLQALVLLTTALLAVRLHAADDPKAARALAALAAVSVLVRPDGIVPAGIVVAALGVTLPAERRWRATLPAAAAVALVVVVHTAGRMAYYGDPLPNTYYLKATGVPLAERIARGAAVLGDVTRTHLGVLLAALALAGAGAPRRMLSFGPALLVALFAGQCVYSVFVGGDAWEWMDYSNRFVAPAVPAALIAAVCGLAAAGARFGRAGALVPLVGAAVLLGGMNGTPIRLWWESNAFHFQDDAEMSRLGIALRGATREDTVPAVVWAGAIPYFARRNCVDLLGKSDPVVAKGPARGRFIPGHNKWNYRHSIGELRPDVIFQTAFVWREPGFIRFLARSGYDRLPNEIWVRRDSDGVDRDALSELPSPTR